MLRSLVNKPGVSNTEYRNNLEAIIPGHGGDRDSLSVLGSSGGGGQDICMGRRDLLYVRDVEMSGEIRFRSVPEGPFGIAEGVARFLGLVWVPGVIWLSSFFPSCMIVWREKIS